MSYLDNTGLAYFWEKIKSNFFPGTKEIPENADLNDYRTPGVYNCPLNPTALTIDNQPPDLIVSGDSYSAFSLVVFKTTADGCRQIYAPFYWSVKAGSSTSVTRVIANNADRIFTRAYYNGEWGDWIEVLTSKIRPAKYTLVGNSSQATLDSTPWFKVATVSFNNSNHDKFFIFMVTDSRWINSASRFDQRFGLLRLHIRTSGVNTSGTFLDFLLNNRYDLEDFKAVFNTSTSEVELWTRCNTEYMSRTFTLIREASMQWQEQRAQVIGPITMYGRIYGLTDNMEASYPTGENYVVISPINVPIKNISSGVQDQGFVRSAGANYSRLTTANGFKAGTGLLEYYNSTSSISIENGAFTYPDGTSKRDAHVLRLPWDNVGRDGACYDSMLAVPNLDSVSANGYPASLGWRTGYGAGCAEQDADGKWIHTTYSDWYHLIDDRYTIDGVHVKKQHTTHYGVCSTAGGTAAKTVDIPHFELVTGAYVIVKFSNDNSASASSLSLNVSNTGAKSIKYRNGNLQSAYDILSNQPYMFVYDGTYWQISNNTYLSHRFDRLRSWSNIKAKSAIGAGSLIAGDETGYFSLNSGNSFDISYGIFYAEDSVTAGSTTGDAYFVALVALSKTQSGTWTVLSPVFIKGTLNGNTFTPVSTAPLTQTVPTTEDGYHYIYLGWMGSSTNLELAPTHPIYEYVNGSFCPYEPKATNADIDSIFD